MILITYKQIEMLDHCDRDQKLSIHDKNAERRAV